MVMFDVEGKPRATLGELLAALNGGQWKIAGAAVMMVENDEFRSTAAEFDLEAWRNLQEQLVEARRLVNFIARRTRANLREDYDHGEKPEFLPETLAKTLARVRALEDAIAWYAAEYGLTKTEKETEDDQGN